MRAYVTTFGDFVINDGTHNIYQYGLIMMMNTLVDALGKSVNVVLFAVPVRAVGPH
jgi:hypothetical protein